MPIPELLKLKLLLGLLIGLLFISGELLLEELIRQELSFRCKCLLCFPLAVCAGMLAFASALIGAPPADMNTYLILVFGFLFTLPMTMFLLRNKWNTDKPADDYRIQLLKAVHTEVAKRLTDSLHNQMLINLPIEEQHHYIGRPQRTLHIFRGRSFQLEPEKKIIDIFKQPDIAGKLLILGAPGSGKTTTLLELARDLIAQAQEAQPIPVLFELSAWKDDQQSITDWLIAELKYKYGVRVDIGKQLLESHQLLPLLDGLDELEATRQGRCIEKINQFLQLENRLPQLVVCSRLEEYNLCKTQLEQLNGAVYLQPLTESQIQTYLTDVKCPKLWQSIQGDSVLKDLSASPFLLTIMVVAYEETTIQQANNSGYEARRQYYLSCLFDAYVQKQLNCPIKSKLYAKKTPDAEKTVRWLKFLAKQLKQESKNEFLIENIQPTWLINNFQRLMSRFLNGLIFGVLFGPCGALISKLLTVDMPSFGVLLFALATAWTFGLCAAMVSNLWLLVSSSGMWFTLFFTMIYARADSVQPGLILLIYWFICLLFGIPLGYVWTIAGQISIAFANIGEKEINTIENLQFSVKGLITGLFLWLMLVVPPLIIFWEMDRQYGLFIFLLSLSFMLQDSKIETKITPNQGIGKSAVNAVIVGASSGLIFGLCFKLSGVANDWCIFIGLFFGLIYGLKHGGTAWIKHFILRIILYLNGYIPWKYAHFLNYATERRLLQRIGGRYRFIHDLLREHFANL